MLLLPRTSEIDGAKHRQNLQILSWAKDSTDALAFKSLMAGTFQAFDEYWLIAATATSPKAFVVKNKVEDQLLVVCCGANGDQQIQALIDAFRTPPVLGGRAAEPYNTAALWIKQATLNDPGRTWDEITLIGYSYGGATALALASWFYREETTERIYTYTYGSPKYGHKSLGNFWRGWIVINVVNYNDPIPSLPPTFTEDTVFNLYVRAGVTTWGPAAANNTSDYTSPMTYYRLVNNGLFLSSSQIPAINRFPLPITQWLLSDDFLGSQEHSLGGYIAAMSRVGAIEFPSFQPQAIPSASVNAPRLTQAEKTRQTRQALQSAGLTTATDPQRAIVQTQQAIISQRGIFFRRGRIGKVPTVTYNGMIVLVCRGIRDQKKIVKQLNKNLRGR